MAKRTAVPKLPSPKKGKRFSHFKKEKRCSVCVPELASNLECVGLFPKLLNQNMEGWGLGICKRAFYDRVPR